MSWTFSVGPSHVLHILCLNAAFSCFDALKPWPLLRSDPLDPFVRQLYRKGIRLQLRAQTIHANYDQHRPITWGKPQELFQFVKTSEYLQLENINSEACEQTNLALSRITISTTFMSPSMYMRSLTLFMADINITANKFKEKYFQSQSWKNDRKYCTILFYYMRMN